MDNNTDPKVNNVPSQPSVSNTPSFVPPQPLIINGTTQPQQHPSTTSGSQKPPVDPNSIKMVRTFADDIKVAVDKNKVSVAKIIVEETKRKEEEKKIEEVSASNPTNMLIVVIGIIFILAGIGTYAYFYLQSNKQPPPVAVPEYKSDIIKTESYKDIDVNNFSKAQVLQEIKKEQENVLLANNVKEITFTTGKIPNKKSISIQDFLILIDSQTPTTLSRSFDPTFFFGFHSIGENQPFIIIRVDSFSNGYAGMLEWEKTIVDDIGMIFFDKEEATTVTSIQQETTPTSTKATSSEEIIESSARLPLPAFKDGVIMNRDIRILNDVNGNPIMIYGFVDKNTIVITSIPETFNEIAERLKATKLIR